MLGHIIAFGIGIAIGIIFIQLFICLWNENNLEMRQYDLARAHLDKAHDLSKRFIRIGSK